ncbi:uncharacterized protein M6 isoform X2 [Procambarus clarkii]|uniref:uncharacterized protein M6 isoform X2 n=1 Tax=Procambarus clarkii TaxID=6728 RepID=UPI003743BC39
MRGADRYSPEEPRRAYGGRETGSYKSIRMRTDWGIYEDPGHVRGGIYSVSDVAGVGVYHDGGDDAGDDLRDDRGGEEKVYGFSPPSAPRLSTGKWSSTHSLAPAASPGRSVHSATAGGHRASLGESHRPAHAPTAAAAAAAPYSRDSLKRRDYSRQHHQARNAPVDALYRSVEKRAVNGRATQQGRGYSASSRGDYGSPASNYRSLRGYPPAADDYDDREPRSFDNCVLSNGYSGRSSEYTTRGQNSLKRSNNKGYFTSSELYNNRRSYPPPEANHNRPTVTKGILTNTGKYGGSARTTALSSYAATDGRNNQSPYSGHNNDEGKNNLSGADTYDKRAGSYASRPAVTSKSSQTELSIASDLQLASSGKTSSSLQVPEGASSGSSRRSSNSTQQVGLTTGADSSSSQQDGKEERYEAGGGGGGRREAGSLRKDRRKNTKDEQNQTDEEMSQWGVQWGPAVGAQYHNHEDPHQRAPPLPRPPMPPQHYPGHDSHPQAAHPSPTPPEQRHYAQQQHNHAHHNHGHHNHVHHTHHARQQSSGSSQTLVRADTSDGYSTMTWCHYWWMRLGVVCDCGFCCYYCCCCCFCCGGRKCRDCMTRVPYATLIATLMCCVGVGVFCGTMYRGTTLTLRLFEDVFKLHIKWVEPVQLTFMVVGAGMGGLGLMILFVGCLSTGDTRNKVYRTWRGRVGGRISCAIFMGITYLLSLAWLTMFAALIIVTLFYTLAWFQCLYIPQNECIDYNQFSFLFPEGTPEEDKRVCTGERKLFCKDYVNNAEIMFILASVSAFLVILSLIHYLMCLAANYAHIKDQEKFMDLQEIQFLHESEMSTLPKDRF